MESKAANAASNDKDKGDGLEPGSSKGDKWRDVHSSMAEQSCRLSFLMLYCIVAAVAVWAWEMDTDAIVAKTGCNGPWHSRASYKSRNGSSF